jgi:hypothetical protein
MMKEGELNAVTLQEKKVRFSEVLSQWFTPMVSMEQTFTSKFSPVAIKLNSTAEKSALEGGNDGFSLVAGLNCYINEIKRININILSFMRDLDGKKKKKLR